MRDCLDALKTFDTFDFTHLHVSGGSIDSQNDLAAPRCYVCGAGDGCGKYPPNLMHQVFCDLDVEFVGGIWPDDLLLKLESLLVVEDHQNISQYNRQHGFHTLLLVT